MYQVPGTRYGTHCNPRKMAHLLREFVEPAVADPGIGQVRDGHKQLLGLFPVALQRHQARSLPFKPRDQNTQKHKNTDMHSTQCTLLHFRRKAETKTTTSNHKSKQQKGDREPNQYQYQVHTRLTAASERILRVGSYVSARLNLTVSQSTRRSSTS